MNDHWAEPSKEAKYLCDDNVVRTWGQIVDGLDAAIYPSCRNDYEMLLWFLGAMPLALDCDSLTH